MKQLLKVSILCVICFFSIFVYGVITVNPDIPDLPVMSSGPRGEKATSAKELILTDSEIEKLKGGNFTAAISFHYSGDDWSAAQLKALRDTFEKMGIKILAVTDAEFKPEKQISDIETIIAMKPDVLVSIPVDPISSAPAFRKAADAGIKIVFMDNVPYNLVPGKDYVAVVSADNYGNGVVSAEIMAEELNNEGTIGMIYHDADYFVTNQRAEAFEKTIKENFPNIEIVSKGGFVEPYEAERVASAMFTRYPKIDGVWVNWDVPAEGVLAAARYSNIKDLVITTIDLGLNVALDIAQGGMIKGLGAQLPYDQGVAEAILAGYSLLGKEVSSSYYALPAVKVTRSNLLESWKLVYHEEAPSILKQYYK